MTAEEVAEEAVEAAVENRARGCLPAALRGPWIGSHAGVNFYEHKDTRARLDQGIGTRVLLEHMGHAPLVETADVKALIDARDSAQLFSRPGAVASGGVGRCASGRDEACVHVGFKTHTATLGEIASWLVDIFRPGDACVGFVVKFIGRTAPRCEADDPSCGPVALCDALTVEPDGPRPLLSELNPKFARYSAGACEHDGDCYLAGCQQACHAWTEPGFISFCSGVAALDCVACGCVDGQCAWFVQDPDCPCASPWVQPQRPPDRQP